MPPVSKVSGSHYWISPGARGPSAPSPPPRTYLDPWDLENYAYLKRACGGGSPPPTSLATSTSQSDFSYYAPAKPPDLPPAIRKSSLAVPEPSQYSGSSTKHSPCKHRRRSVAFDDAVHYASYSDDVYGPLSLQEEGYLYHPHPELDDLYGSSLYLYNTPSRIVPCPCPHHYRDYHDLCSALTLQKEEQIYMDTVRKLVARNRRRVSKSSKATPDQFGMNTLGHLKIDYSANWTNLDKYISHSC